MVNHWFVPQRLKQELTFIFHSYRARFFLFPIHFCRLHVLYIQNSKKLKSIEASWKNRFRTCKMKPQPSSSSQWADQWGKCYNSFPTVFEISITCSPSFLILKNLVLYSEVGQGHWSTERPWPLSARPWVFSTPVNFNSECCYLTSITPLQNSLFG